MVNITAIFLTIIFFILSAIHFSWVFRSKWGFNNVLPTNLKGERILKPKKLDSLVVAIGLLLFGLVYVYIVKPNDIDITNWVITYGLWIIPSIFLLRVLGDFKYVGLFKKVKKTPFGKRDTKYFIPLCSCISILGYYIATKI